jgi:hypothetical protein
MEPQFLDANALDVRPIIAAADSFLRRHHAYLAWVSGVGRDDPLISTDLCAETRCALQELGDALDAAGVAGRLMGTPERVPGLNWLRLGASRLAEALEGSPFAVRSWVMGTPQVSLRVPAGAVVSFDPLGVAQVELGAGLLRAEERPPVSPPLPPAVDGQVPNRRLGPAEEKILDHCRDKPRKGERIANWLGLSNEHTRRLLARLTKEGRLRNDGGGYLTV